MAAVTRYCPSCGVERREGDKFCRSCGAVLGTGGTRLTATPEGAQAPAAQAPVDQLPAPPIVAPAPGPVGGAGRSRAGGLPMKPLAFGGGVAIVIGTFLPWVSAGGASTNALDIPVQFLFSLNASDGPIKVGFVTLGIGIAAAVLSFLPKTAWARRLCGSIGVAVGLAFMLQLFRTIDQAGGSFGDLFSTIGLGAYLALAGAISLQISR